MRKSKPKYAIIVNSDVVSYNLTKFCNDNHICFQTFKKYKTVTINNIEYKLVELWLANRKYNYI